MTEAVDKLRAEARAHEKEAYDSFERCDTDGFMSQWASGINARQKRMEADLLERGGVLYVVGPVRADDRSPVTWRRVETRYGSRWIVLPDGDPDGEPLVWLNAGAARLATIRKHGYTLGVYRTEGKVKLFGNDAVNVQPWIVPKQTTITTENATLVAAVPSDAQQVDDAYELRQEFEDQTR